MREKLYIIKRATGSLLLLTGAALLAVQAVISLLQYLDMASNLKGAMFLLYAIPAVARLAGLSGLFCLLLVLPKFLICLGLLFLFFSSLGDGRPFGFFAARFGLVLDTIWTIIGILILVILALAAGSPQTTPILQYFGMMSNEIRSILIALIVLFVFRFLYICAANSMISYLKRSCFGRQSLTKPPLFFVIMTIPNLFLPILTMITSNASLFSRLLSSGTYIAGTALLAVVVLRLRSEVSRYRKREEEMTGGYYY